jgi:hypothetical protein
LAAGDRRPDRVGPRGSPAGERRRRLHRLRPRCRPLGAVPPRPGVRLRPAHRGLRAAAARGHAHGHALGGLLGGPECARPRRDRSSARPHRRPARRRGRGRRPGRRLTDDILRDDLAARGSSFASARTWHAAAGAHVRLWRRLA